MYKKEQSSLITCLVMTKHKYSCSDASKISTNQPYGLIATLLVSLHNLIMTLNLSCPGDISLIENYKTKIQFTAKITMYVMRTSHKI